MMRLLLVGRSSNRPPQIGVILSIDLLMLLRGGDLGRTTVSDLDVLHVIVRLLVLVARQTFTLLLVLMMLLVMRMRMMFMQSVGLGLLDEK